MLIQSVKWESRNYSHTNENAGIIVTPIGFRDFNSVVILKIPIFFVFAVINTTLVVSAIAVIGLSLDLIIRIFLLC